MIAVLGAGAAGLMAAIHAARAGARVVLLERTGDGGRKILISGGGRCNVLPASLDERRFVTDSSPRLAARLLRSWPLAGQRAFFEEALGIPLALEPETGKLFPVSNRAREVRDRLVGEARRAGVELAMGVRVADLAPGTGGWTVSLADGPPLAARRVIVATGGRSVPATGSDGAFLEVAERLGHRVNPTYPALTPLLADPPVHGTLAGLSLPVAIRARDDLRAAESAGGFLFTHRGYSGPSVLDVSHVAVRSRLEGRGDARIAVRWGGLDPGAWEARLQAQSRQAVTSCLREVLPARLAERLAADCGVPPERTLAQLTRAERKALVAALTGYPLPWTGDEGYRKAEVTGGGVALEEVDPVTLESRRAPGLHFAGEILDAFGPIGGYNFAWAWATGRAAGLGAAR